MADEPRYRDPVAQAAYEVLRGDSPPSPPSPAEPTASETKGGERAGTKTLDYIALGLLLASPAVVVEMYIKDEPINWSKTAVATAVCWVAGGFFVVASHGWQSWRSANVSVLPYLAAAESKFWVKGIIVAICMGGALALSSILSNAPPTPARAPKAEAVAPTIPAPKSAVPESAEKLVKDPAIEWDLGNVMFMSTALQTGDDLQFYLDIQQGTYDPSSIAHVVGGQFYRNTRVKIGSIEHFAREQRLPITLATVSYNAQGKNPVFKWGDEIYKNSGVSANGEYLGRIVILHKDKSEEYYYFMIMPKGQASLPLVIGPDTIDVFLKWDSNGG